MVIRETNAQQNMRDKRKLSTWKHNEIESFLFLASALKSMSWKFTCKFAFAWAFLAGVNQLYITVRAQNGQNISDEVRKS